MNESWKTYVDYYKLAMTPFIVLLFIVLLVAGWKPFFIFLGICVGIGILIILALIIYEEKVDRPKRIQRIQEIESLNAKEMDKEKKILAEHNKKLAELDEKYGKCTKYVIFDFRSYHKRRIFHNFIRLYLESSVIVSDWGKTVINIADILRVSVHDSCKPNMGPVSAQTSTSGKSMLGRATAGYVIGGGVGAIIGGATAKQNTTFSYSDNEKHDYTVLINTKDLSNPLVKIHTKDDIRATEEIEALILAIINSPK